VNEEYEVLDEAGEAVAAKPVKMGKKGGKNAIGTNEDEYEFV
jgi:hypothetical protein